MSTCPGAASTRGYDGAEAETAATAETPTARRASASGHQPMNTESQQIRIVGPNFVAGLIISNDHVIRAAPILGYMIGWPTEKIIALAQRHGWIVEYNTR